MPDMTVVESGMKAGGLLWISSGLAIFIPLWLKLAWPLWGKPGRLGEFALQSFLVLVSSTVPFGLLFGGALLFRELSEEGTFDSDEVASKAEAS